MIATKLRTIGSQISSLKSREAVLQAAVLLDAASGKSTLAMIPLPDHLAARFPAGEYRPHITLCYITSGDQTPGMTSQLMMAMRRAANAVRPFRIMADTNAGLQEFGDGDDGTKALWFGVLDRPEDALAKLHYAIKLSLLDEKLPCDDSHPKYTPHITWTYVPNDIAEKDRNRHDAVAASRFTDTPLAFAVNSFCLALPDGTVKPVLLNPNAK